MAKSTRKKWPFNFSLRESVVTSLMSPIHLPYIVVFQLKSCQLLIDQSVERLDIDHFTSRSPDGKSIIWQVIDNSINLAQLQQAGDCLVIRTYP